MQSNNPYTRTPSSTSPATPTPGAPAPEPSDAPPNYSTATGSSTTTPSHQRAHSQTLEVPTSGRASSEFTASDDESGHGHIPSAERASMEEESRELPEGWIRQYDENAGHWFYVDVRATPPRSIWVHPYSDRQYVMSLPESSEVRQHYANLLEAAQVDAKNISSSSSQSQSQSTGSASASGSGSRAQQPQQPEKKTFGRKLKDSLTGSTHEERVKQRKAKQEQEIRDYKAFVARREAMAAQRQQAYAQQAAYYAAPQSQYPMGYQNARMNGYGYSNQGMYGGGYNSGYGGGGMYGNNGYGRRGGGMGGAGLAGGLLGGVLLGSLLF
ncbi:hypothetical protein RQP46_000956 [Phenoliferia psychrophenolica]